MKKNEKPVGPESTRPPGLEDTVESRYVCDILDSMRDCDKTRTYGHLPGLIEQAQEYVNRMETGLSNSKQTARQAYELMSKKKTPEAMKVLKDRWPKIDQKNVY